MLKKFLSITPAWKKHVTPIGLLSLSILFFFGNSACSSGNQAVGKSLQAAQINNVESEDEPTDSACAYFYFLWGNSAESEGKYDEALEAYEKSLVCDPHADYVNQKLVILLFNMGKKEQSITQLEKMIADNPSDLQYRLLLGNIYTSMGEKEKAIDVYEEVLRISPDDPQTLLMLGALYASNRDLLKARTTLEKLVKVDNRSINGYNYLAKVYRELNFFDESIEAYKKALDLNWTPILAYEAADLYEYRQRYDEAVAIYKRLLEEDETNTKIRGRLARIYLVQGKVDDALAELQELKNYTTSTDTVDLAIGRILLDEKRYTEAITLFEGMLARNENKDVARSMLALTYYESGNTEKAKTILRQVPVTSKDYEESILMLAQILLGEKDTPRAITLLRNEIATEQTRRSSFYFLLANLLREEGDSAAGKEIFEQALLVFPGNDKILVEYGLFFDRLGDVEQAVEKMEQALAIAPDNFHALNYLGYTWADKGVNLEKALEYTKKAVALQPDDGFIRDSLGWAYFKMGRYAEAVVELEAAAGMQPEDPTIHEHLGDAYRMAGDLEKAVEAYEKAVRLYSDDAKKAHALSEIKALQNSEKKE